MLRKSIALLMCMVVMFTVFAGCGQKTETGSTGEQKEPVQTEETSKPTEPKVEEKIENFNAAGYPIVPEKITVKMMTFRAASHGSYDEMLLFTEMEKKTNIHIEWDVVDSNVGNEKKNIYLASGDYPDVFYNCNFSTAEIVNYSQQGILVPLTDLIKKYGPNLSKLINGSKQIKAGLTSSDGEIYSYPYLVLSQGINLEPKQVRVKWLEKLNLKMPTNLDEYYNVLKAFKEDDPNDNGQQDEIPISGWGGNNGSISKEINFLSGSFGLGNLVGGFSNEMHKNAQGKLELDAVSPKYRDILAFLNKLYSEKLIDSEIFAQKQPQAFAKGQKDLVGMIMHSNPASSFKMAAEEFEPMPPLKGPDGDQVFASLNAMIRTPGKFVITDKCKYQEAMVRWVDYFFSEEGAKLVRLGVEGITYNLDADGTPVYTDFVNKNPNGLSRDQALGTFTNFAGTGGVYCQTYEVLEKTMQENFKKAEKATKEYWPEEILSSLFFAADEQAELNALEADINSYINEMTVMFIVGDVQLSDASWNDYLGTLDKMGLKRLTEIYQKAYDRIK